jgi:thymidylate kinase
MKRVTLMGIDGSGKTTLMRAAQRAIGDRSSFLFSPDFHEIPGFARGQESHALTQFSRLADSYADPGLKLASLYLRMCLFGEAEAFLTATEARSSMCMERHPLLDSLTYLPVYIAAVERSNARLEESGTTKDFATRTREGMARLEQEHPEIAAHVRTAIERRNTHLGRADHSIDQIATYCMGFGSYSPADFVRALSRDYQTTLPQVMLYLDIPPEEAFARIGARGKALEAHESLENLRRLDRLARSAFKAFASLGVAVHLLKVCEQSEAATVAEVAGHLEATTA